MKYRYYCLWGFSSEGPRIFYALFPFKWGFFVMGLLEAAICLNRENAMEDKTYEQYSLK